nr:hypothetical protein [Candidatus Arsenophonus triatominarum]
MKKRIQRLEMENDILKKATALLMSDSLKNSSVVEKLRALYPVKALCRIFSIHRSSYRYWCRPKAPDGKT